MIKSDIAACALKLMGSCVAAPSTAAMTAGLFLAPVFSYKPGNLYGEEFASLKVLSNAGCMVDSAFQLTFDVKSKTETRLNLVTLVSTLSMTRCVRCLKLICHNPVVTSCHGQGQPGSTALGIPRETDQPYAGKLGPGGGCFPMDLEGQQPGATPTN